MVNSSTFMQCMASYNHQIDVTYVWYHGNVLVEFERVYRLGENRYEVWINPHYKRVCIQRDPLSLKSLLTFM